MAVASLLRKLLLAPDDQDLCLLNLFVVQSRLIRCSTLIIWQHSVPMRVLKKSSMSIKVELIHWCSIGGLRHGSLSDGHTQLVDSKGFLQKI
jgi:hypothetical protein